MNECNVLLGCCGSVASLKVPDIVNSVCQLTTCQVNLKVVATEHATHFFDTLTLPVPIFRDADVLQALNCSFELSQWADMLVIAPLDANTLGKISSGIADNLLTMIVRGWTQGRPLLFAPAMNTFMWNHPITAPQISVLKSFGFEEIPCIEKKLVCGDTGMGAMAAVETIVARIEHHLQDLLKGRPRKIIPANDDEVKP